MTAATYADGVSLRSGLRACTQSFVLRGRATRSELASALILIAFGEAMLLVLVHFFHPPTALGLPILWRRVAFEQSLALLLLVPLIGLGARRLHDVGLPVLPGVVLALIVLAGWLNRQQVAIGLHGGLPVLSWAAPVALTILVIALFWSPMIGTNRFGADPRAR
ncbi:DUF805 domain-containing protein [Sphingomonas sp. HT-1]|uniref:DUF805 domain-containing protein n=1 Tax=unclassified Sphingomonas TaxID=196159 RepID=UPI0002EA7666|nr:MULTISPECIES: DUF805 domain-containing protein [unclassified Sphingomonas]KTF68235.1 hypothetical protein ATB93_14575 [Sphingomonas sp. WG]